MIETLEEDLTIAEKIGLMMEYDAGKEILETMIYDILEIAIILTVTEEGTIDDQDDTMITT